MGTQSYMDYMDTDYSDSSNWRFDLHNMEKIQAMSNQYYEWNDGWFNYYVNVETGDKKLELEKGDVLVSHPIDDFVPIVQGGYHGA